jgi:hypothetical protein
MSSDTTPSYLFNLVNDCVLFVSKYFSYGK